MESKSTKQEINDWVIICQGTTQLLTAAGAVFACASTKGRILKPENIVVLVFDLACPESRLTAFRQAIIELALANYGWFRVEILDANTTGFGDHISMPSIEPEKVEAVFSCRNHNRNDQEIMNYFRSSNQFCYGDSVGIFTPQNYLAARIDRSYSDLVNDLKRITRSFLVKVGIIPASTEVASDIINYKAGYFTIAEAGGGKPEFAVINTDISVMFSGYRALAERLRELVLAEEISPKEIGAPLTVLLTSTQSEWGRMTTESEIEAYLSLVAQNSMPGPLIIKPHPRENQAKISDLVSRLRGLGWEVLNLANNELLAMMPVESQLLTLEAEFGVTVLTTSSAAYGVALICGVKPVIGFGSDLVKKYFKPEYQTMRLEHEKLLISYSNKFLSLHQNWSMCDSNKNCSQGEIMPIDYTHSQNLHTITGPLAAIPKLFHNTRPLSVLDVGCGTGTWLKAFIDLGTADVVGVDAVEIPEDQLLIPIDRFHLINLERPWDLERKFDVVLCLEVAEHLDEADASQFILSLTIHADIIFFSAACPNQLGQHHVNCQWPAYWQALFNLYGYSCLDEIRWSLWDDVRIEPWYRQNMFVAQRNLQTSGKEPRIKPVIHPDMIQYLTRL